MDENSVQGLGFISRLKNRLSQVNQRTALDAFIVLLILIGLAASVYLAGQRQIFRSRAAQEGNAVVVDQNGQPIEQKEGDATVVETQQIRLKIDFPTDWNTQSILPQINSAHAQTSAPSITSADWFAYGILIVNGSNFGSSTGTVYYSPGGSAESSLSIRYWSNTSIQVSTPNNAVDLSGYLRICRSDGECSNWWSGIPVYGAIQPPAQPTSTPIPTATPTSATCRGTGGHCASPDNQNRGVTSEGLLCSSYLGNSVLDRSCANESSGYNYCYLNCATPTAAAQPTAIPTQAQGCRANWEGKRTLCTAEDNRPNCTYLDAWSRPRSNVCSASTPFCWACPESAFGAPPPAGGPTATPPQTITQPPTATPIPEQTQWIRVSLNQDRVRDGNCYNPDLPEKQGLGNPNPREHCMEFSITHQDFLAKGNAIDWGLPNEAGTYTIYTGFVSNKGTLKSAPPVKVTYRPKVSPTPRATGSPTSVLDSLAGATNVSCINGRALQYSSGTAEGVDTGYFCRCRQNDTGVKIAMIVDPETGKDLAETNSPCQGGVGSLPALPQPTVQPTPPTTTCDQLYEECMNTVEATKETCDRMKANCKSLPFVSTPTPTPTSPAPSPTPSAALPITGKVKITANGTQYKSVIVSYYDDNSRVKKVQVLEGYLPTNRDQEGGSYTTEPMRRSQTPVWPVVYLSAGGEISNSTKVDCPSRPTNTSYGCVSEKGSTQNFSVTLPTASSQVSLGPLLGNPENPDPGMIYVKNNQDQQVTVQKVEQFTSEPTFSLWFLQFGAGYTQLNSQPISIEPKKYVSFEAIVVACSRSDMENLKEKEVKVNYTIDTEIMDPTIGSIPHEAKGKYQCGGSGSVIIP